MESSLYEENLIGRMAVTRPPQPNVIALAIKAIRRENYRWEPHGHHIWENGRWTGPLKLDDLMRAANLRLKERGEPQIDVNPNWRV